VSSGPPRFAFTVNSSFACGGSIAFTLTVAAAQGSWSRPFRARVGTQTTTSSAVNATDVPSSARSPSLEECDNP